jgi:phosphotransferase system enzyme I (PtsI)
MSSKVEQIFKGLAASKGISIGKTFVYKVDLPNYEIKSNGSISPENEINDYSSAISQSIKELNKVFNLAKEKLNDKNLQIFDAQLSFLYDEYLHSKVKERIRQERKSASQVFKEEIRHLESALLDSNDEYLRERINDIEDIKGRVLRNLIKGRLVSKIEEDRIVIARNLTPADTILFSNRRMLGIATELGGINSHVAIISRSLNIPAVVGVKDIVSGVHPDDFLIIDGYKGLVIKNPSEETIAAYKKQVERNIEIENKLTELEKLPSTTKDGVKIRLSANLEFNNEVDYVVSHFGCDVGLYRTEHLFMELGDFPDEETQYKQYKFLAEHISPKHVTIRTFDIGGDKILPESQKELNPFLGWRAIRMCLDKKDVFMNQLRAILRASAYGNVKIMFPLVASLDELLAAKKMLEEAKAELKGKGIKYDDNIQVSVMIEVPSAVMIADALAKEVNFFSLGTNDLVQYMLAVDRDSSLVSELYQKFHPGVLRAIKMTVESAERNNIPVSVCGEMASDPYSSLLLIGLGVKILSVEAKSYLQIKRLIRLVNYQNAKEIADKILTMNTEKEIKEYITEQFDKNIGEKLKSD